MSHYKGNDVEANAGSHAGPRVSATAGQENQAKSDRPEGSRAAPRKTTSWAWSESPGHFDWMDLYTPSGAPELTDFSL